MLSSLTTPVSLQSSSFADGNFSDFPYIQYLTRKFEVVVAGRIWMRLQSSRSNALENDDIIMLIISVLSVE